MLKVRTKQIEDINGKLINYVIVESTVTGERHNIHVGEKTLKKLDDMLLREHFPSENEDSHHDEE